MKLIEIDDDVYSELQQRAEKDVILRGLLKLMRVHEDPTIEPAVVRPENNQSSNGSSRSPKLRDQFVPTIRSSPVISSRRLGLEIRHKYAKRYGMTPLEGVVYLRGQQPVVMPFATERNPDHWFLGVPFRLFAKNVTPCLVLLCWKDDQLLDFVIPPEKANVLVSGLTINASRQYLFNVVWRNADTYDLLVPNGRQDISKYLHADGFLKAKA